MTRLLLLALLLAFQAGGGVLEVAAPMCALHAAQDRGICDGSETPCNPDQPWHRGRIHKGCNRSGKPPKEANPVIKEWKPCQCKHGCDPDKKNDETGGRSPWDASCAARCSASFCECRPNPCQKETE